MPRESRHVWVGNLPENVKEEEVAVYFSRYGRVEKIKLLPKISPDGGRAAFVDFVDIRSATKANEAQNRMGERDLRTNYNEPGNKQQQQRQDDFDRNHAMIQHHRIHGGYAPPGAIGYQRPVVIYAAPPPHVDHVIHAAPPYRPIYQRDDRRLPYQPRRERGRSPGSKGSASDGDRSPSPGRRAGYSSGSDTNDKTDKSTVLVKNLYAKGTSDTSLEEALYHEFKKYGEILNINIKGTGVDRYAYVQFSKPEEAESATRSNGKLFLGQDMKVAIKSSAQRSRSSGGVVIPLEDLAFDPHATRTVFVGNLDKGMMHGELRNIFERFGEVVDVDIKKMQAGITTYAFVQFIDINSATLAKRKMDRQAVGNNRIKVGYGRGTPTNSLWVGNLPLKVTEHDISKYFLPFGHVQRVLVDRKVWQALIRFETIEACTKAFAEMHGQSFLGKRIAVDYASPACRNAFYTRMEKHGMLDRRQLEPSPTPPDSHINFQNAARGGPFQPRGGFGNNGQREDHRSSDRYSDRFERDGGGHDSSRPRDRSRGYSLMSRGSMSPKRAGVPRESISPVRSDRTDSRNKRRRSVGSPVPDQEPPKKKEKKKKKDKRDKNKKASKAGKGTMELSYNMNEEQPSPTLTVPKSKAELKKEKKEKKKVEKARKKAEKKEKKLKELKNLQDKLTSIQAAVNNDGVLPDDRNGTTVNNNEVHVEESQPHLNNVISAEKHVPTEAVSEISEGEGPALHSTKQPNNGMERVSEGEQNDGTSSQSPVNNNKEEHATAAMDQPPPASPDQEDQDSQPPPKLRNETAAGARKKEPEKQQTQTPPSNDDSSDSSSSSSSSSDSDDSDDSSDNDNNKAAKHVSRKTVKERDIAVAVKRRSLDADEKPPHETARREPKAYRQDRGEPEPDYKRRDRSKEGSYPDRDREREREKEYSRMKQHEYYRSSSNKDRNRSKSPSGYRPRSRSRSPYERKRGRSPERRSPRYEQCKTSYDSRNEKYTSQKDPPPPPPSKDNRKQAPTGVNQSAPPVSQNADTLMDLLRRFPVMWQGLLGLKNDTAAVQMHFLSGDIRLAETSLPRGAQPHEVPPPLRISQRMKLEPSQLEGVDNRIQSPKEHCMLLALPCGRDPLDVHAQTRALKTGFITYLQQKQAAGIVNVPNPSTKQPVYVIHIFPPCEFAQGHLVRVAPDLLDSAVESGHLMVLITPI